MFFLVLGARMCDEEFLYQTSIGRGCVVKWVILLQKMGVERGKIAMKGATYLRYTLHRNCVAECEIL